MAIDVRSEVEKKIAGYSPQGRLDHTTRLFLVLAGIRHSQVREHMERVGLLSEKTAFFLKMDAKAAFFAGLLHDVGKLILPEELFDSHNITNKEYAKIKEHALDGFLALAPFHLFVSLCAGLHHNLYKAGYGLGIKDFPTDWSPATAEKVLVISAIVSICDFIDAFTHRKTVIKDGSDQKTVGLREMLEKKYPDNILLVETALRAFQKLGI